MSDTFKNMETTVPVLTLDPFGEEEKAVEVAEEKAVDRKSVV